MSLLRFLLNLAWILTGGLWMAVGWVIAGVLMAITIIGLPWTRAAFNIALYTFLPFGTTTVSRARFTGEEDFGTGPLGVLGNIIWLVLAGWWLAIAHLIFAIGLAVTLIGIPFAWAHLKLVPISLWPIGRMVVTVEEARARGFA
ncbi:MAG: YccF domain-containing protein [Stellaceae bacterium]